MQTVNKVSEIRNNLKGILDTSPKAAQGTVLSYAETKLEFKEEDCSKSDNGSQENVGVIEYVKIG
jgi:hypothetical protein|tara:strand:+ start:126 stop:320 length:195 start_codon:yes stop_codon:yes gene_type:complete